MPRPAATLLNDYLKGIELLDVLRDKLQHIQVHAKNLTDLGYDVAEIKESLDDKMYRLEIWISETDRELDDALEYSAQRADLGRELFQSLQRSIQQWKSLSPQQWEELPEELRMEWSLLLDGFEILSSIWNGYLPRTDRGEAGG